VSRSSRSMKLRPYQDDAIAGVLEALRVHRRVLACMPTGTGKTCTFMALAKRYVDAGHRILILAHRRELLVQAWKKGLALGIAASGMAFEQAEHHDAGPNSLVVFSTTPSMLSRLDQFPPGHFQLVILDEGHRILAPSNMAIVEHFGARTQAWTATPNRGDEKALAQVINAVGYDMTLGDALAGGWLVPPHFEVVETSAELSTVRSRNGELMAGELGVVLSEINVLRESIGPSLKRASRLKGLVFCATRAHMACVAQCIREMTEERLIDLPIDCVDGTTPDGERDRIFAEFHAHETGRGKGRWLLNVDVATEGFDVPDVEALILLRPTLARSRYMQMVGRGLRPLDGLIDGVDVSEMLVRLDLAEFRGAELEHLAKHRLALMTGGDDALARRIAIATSTKPACLILDFAGSSGKHELANPLDLLGGDFEPAERRDAQRLVDAGDAPNLWAALEQVRAAKAAKLQERLARAGDPFALFGIPLPAKDRHGRVANAKQLAVIDGLGSPRRVDDAREAEALVRELARRDRAGLALYSQAALLAALGHSIERVRAFSRCEAGRMVREAAANRWQSVRRGA
jgi:superfamily II DNA or RNA helicase